MKTFEIYYISRNREQKEYNSEIITAQTEESALKKFAKVNTFIAIPYNPYEPQPYQFWTLAGMLDLQEELMVAEKFWDFLGGQGAYIELLNCFEQAGIELRPEIDAYFAKFNNK